MNEAITALRELMEKLSITAEEAWPMVVAHTSTRAWCMVFVGIFVALIGSASLAVGIKMLVFGSKESPPGDPSGYSIAGLFLVIIAIGAIVGGMCGGISYLPDALQPEGATIRMILGK